MNEQMYLLRSHMRTVFPAAAYSTDPDGFRAIWLIWHSPCAKVIVRVVVPAHASPDTTCPDELWKRRRIKEGQDESNEQSFTVLICHFSATWNTSLSRKSISLNHFYLISPRLQFLFSFTAPNGSIWQVSGRKLTWACGHTWQSRECPTPWCKRWRRRRRDRRKDSIWWKPRCSGGLWGWRSPDRWPGSTSYRCDLQEGWRAVLILCLGWH